MPTSKFHHHHLLHLLVYLWLFSFTLQENSTCNILGCGDGRCMADNDSLSYHCECNRGWKTLMVAPMPYPSCIVPNCSLNLPCGNKAPPPPPPPPPSPFNITNSCTFVWCGDGDCVTNGTKHYCRCRNDSNNLFNNSSLICMKQCSFNADCNHLGINILSPPAPPPSSDTSHVYGKNKVAYTVAELSLIAVILAATIIL